MIIPLKIGAQIFGVHKSYVDKKLQNGKIIVGKIKSYQNINGTVHPIIKEVGSSYIFDTKMHYIYADLGQAIEAITTEKKLVIKKQKIKQSKSVLKILGYSSNTNLA